MTKAAIALVALALTSGATRASDDGTDPCAQIAPQVWKIVAGSYGEEDFDPQVWQRHEPPPGAAIAPLLRELDDPAVRILGPEQAAALMDQFSGAAWPGVGLFELLSIDTDEATRQLTIVTPVPGGPAARAGLRPGDVVLRAGGRPPPTLHDAMTLLRGEPGGQVTVTVRRGPRVFDVELPYEAVDPDRMMVLSAVRGDVGLLGIYEFTSGVAERARRALADLDAAGVRGVILDLRNDPGGSLEEAIAVADLFLTAGTEVVTLRSRGETAQVFACREPAVWKKPLVVLVNHGSASAAEVVAGALQAAGRAQLVGSATFGKGLAHTGEPLGDCGLLMLPMGRLVTPHGRDLLEEGLTPDVEVDPSAWPVLSGDPALVGSDGDPEFQAARALLRR